MEIAELFFTRYEDLRSAIEELVVCPEAEWRARPYGLNPITWLVWHMARAEDSGLNRLVFDRPQVLDDPVARWPARMRIPLRHNGSTMPSDEVDALNSQADAGALWAYSVAVAERARSSGSSIRPSPTGPPPSPICAGRSPMRGRCGRGTPGPRSLPCIAERRAGRSSSCSA